MRLHFYKYQATGNDFVLIDNRADKFRLSVDQIKNICNRRFGVGADGLILIEKNERADFEMIYYNSDGSQSLCGNGCRSAVNFAASLELIGTETSFLAYDGVHHASILQDSIVKLKMNDVREIINMNGDFSINTGSPHYIRFVTQLDKVDVVEQGRKIRYSDIFMPGGTNANFVELLPNNTIAIRTYERGVEDETLSCGTGVTAAALAASLKGYHSPITVHVRGGQLHVEFENSHRVENLAARGNEQISFTEIFLIGPAIKVFDGYLEV